MKKDRRYNVVLGDYRMRSRAVYCGPWALSFLTGESVYRIETHINWHRDKPGSRVVRGMLIGEMEPVLRKLGWYVIDAYPNVRASFHRVPWHLERGDFVDGRYLVLVPRHFIVVSSRKWWDNVHPRGVYHSKKPYNRNVRGIWQLITDKQKEMRDGA